MVSSFHSIHARLWSINACFAPNRYVQEVFHPISVFWRKEKKFKRNLILGCFLMEVGEGSPASSCLLLLLLQSRQLRLRPEFPLHWLSAKLHSMSRSEKFQTPHGLQCVTWLCLTPKCFHLPAVRHHYRQEFSLRIWQPEKTVSDALCRGWGSFFVLIKNLGFYRVMWCDFYYDSELTHLRSLTCRQSE